MQDEIEIVGIKDRQESRHGVEMFRKPLIVQVAITRNPLRGVGAKMERGQVLCSPAASPPHQVHGVTCSADEGGRHTPFFNKYALSSISAPLA